jgi:hypothetical protein
VQEENAVIIYLHDPRSPWPRYRSFATHKAAADVEHIVISATMSMSQVAQAVIRKAGKPRNIWLLVMLAHGNKGFLQMGRGLTRSTAGSFSVLRPYMAPGGRGIEIHGCAVASDTPVADNPSVGLQGVGRSSPTSGVNMLIALAKAAQCTTKGAVDAQAVYSNGPNSGRFNGPYVVVSASGIVAVRQGDSVHWSR